MMIVYEGENLPDEQIYYNKRICKARNLVERCIGVLKSRFRCMNDERRLRYHPRKASTIISACATLHNYLIRHRFNALNGIDEHDVQNYFNAAHQNQFNRLHFHRIGVEIRNELKDLLMLQRIEV